jgi:hypothetical protein
MQVKQKLSPPRSAHPEFHEEKDDGSFTPCWNQLKAKFSSQKDGPFLKNFFFKNNANTFETTL